MKGAEEPMDEQLQKWLDGELTDQQWERYKQTSGRQKDLEEIEKVIGHTAHWEPTGPVMSQEQAWKAIQRRLGEQPVKIVPLWRRPVWVAAAASLVFLLSLWVFWDRGEMRIDNRAGTQLAHKLPDKSQVTMNGESWIAYTPRGWKEHRQVQLSGEAFFEVVPGNTFTVLSENGSVTVLGTSFNVISRGGHFEVACASGEVRVDTHGANSITLRAGQLTRLNEGQLEPAQPFNEDRVLGWKKGYFYYSGADLEAVLEDLQEELDVVIITEVDLEGKVYTGFFDKNNREQALESVLGPMGLRFQIQEDTVRIE